MKFVKFFNELGKNDISIAGGKGANLGEMKRAGLPVPDGFVVTAQVYKYSLEKNNATSKIIQLLKGLDVNNQKQLSEVTKRIRSIIENIKIPNEVELEIKKAYKKLVGKKETAVAVRSSATAEDIPSASFAGEQITLLNVKGEKEVIKAIKKCWASLFTERATFYRAEKGFSHEKVLIAVPVQIQLGVLSEEEYKKGKYKAGIGFTIHPVTGEKDKIVIEASYGQGEEVVSGKVTPDTYIFDKKTGKLIEKRVGSKEKMKITADIGLKEIETPKELRNKECLTQKELKQLYKLALLLERHYDFPQDFEWASQNEKVYLLQTRPVTAFFEKKESKLRINIKPLTKGLPASPGVGIGEAKVVFSPKESDKLKEGDVLVTKRTNPDFVPLMKKASAIVTDEGGMTCVSGNTILLTDKGFIRAKELYEKISNKENFKILSFDTKTNSFVFKPIIAAGKNRKKIIRVQIFSKRKNENLDVLDISPDHKFITFSNGELSKIPLESLLEENLGVLIPEKIGGLEKRDIGNKLAYILGLTITDGYVKLTNRHGLLVLSQKLDGTRELVGKRFAEYLTSLTGRDVKFYKKPCVATIKGKEVISSQNNFNLTLHDKQFVTSLTSLLENLDQAVLHIPENDLKYFLGGVLDGDGSFASDEKRLHIYVNPTKRKHFEAIMLSLLELGIHPQVCFNRDIYNLQITESIERLTNFALRFQNSILHKRTKYKSTRYFVAKQILKDLVPKISYKGRLKVYIKKDRIVGEKVIKDIINIAKEKGIEVSKLEKILASPFRQARIRKIKDLGIDEVYNFEVGSIDELDKNFVVFTNTLTPVLVSNSHAAIVSRELGIPCVVGTGNATKVVKGIVTVDGREGFVYPGKIEELASREKAFTVTPEEVKGLKTKTKILMNLGVPNEIEKYKDLPFEGIGLMRIEFIIASWVKEHPNYLLEKHEESKYVDKLAEGIAIVAKAIYPRFVVVRFSDFKTNEYRNLIGGEKFEPVEENPMIGWRGVSRYISPQFEKAFRLECRAIKKVREEYKLNNVWVMLPFVRTTWEVEKALKIMEEEGLKRSEDFKVWLMAEVPSIVFMAEEFSKLCDGFSIGSNDLTQLVLGVDRDSDLLANMGYFDERNEAVKRAIQELIKKAHKNKVTVSICGQAPSVYPEFTEFLVRNKIDSISVNPDTVAKTKKLVYGVEKELKRRK